MSANSDPQLGQRVRFARLDHPDVSPGSTGRISQLRGDGWFFVTIDRGGLFGWTSFDSWRPER